MVQPVRVQLGDHYPPDMWDLHKAVAEARRAGDPLVFIDAWIPINVPPLGIAIESSSLYLTGVRPRGTIWYEFAPDTQRANPDDTSPPRRRLEGSRWIRAGGGPALSSYNALRLDWMIRAVPGARGAISYPHRPIDLLRFFHAWNGQIADFESRLSVCVLIFLFCEALRFRSIDSVCARWLSSRNQHAYGADQSIAHVAEPFTITAAMLDRVRNWRTLGRAGDPDVWLRPPTMPDPVIG